MLRNTAVRERPLTRCSDNGSNPGAAYLKRRSADFYFYLRLLLVTRDRDPGFGDLLLLIVASRPRACRPGRTKMKMSKALVRFSSLNGGLRAYALCGLGLHKQKARRVAADLEQAPFASQVSGRAPRRDFE